MQQILTYAFLVIYTVTILGIVLVIITDNRNPPVSYTHLRAHET